MLQVTVTEVSMLQGIHCNSGVHVTKQTLTEVSMLQVIVTEVSILQVTVTDMFMLQVTVQKCPCYKAGTVTKVSMLQSRYCNRGVHVTSHCNRGVHVTKQVL